MKSFLLVVGAVVVVLAIITVAALIGGTIVFWLWPVAIPALFPRVVQEGWLATRLTWWQAVTAVWILGILIKSSASASSKKSD
jgi:hypothetical protein